MTARALVTVVAAAVGAGCGGGEEGAAPRAPGDASPAPIACTRASCAGAVAVRLRGVPSHAASAEVCVDGRCEEVRQPVPEEVRVALDAENRTGGPDVRRVRATAEIRDAAGAVVARGSSPAELTALRPNGRRCTPTCWGGEAAVTLRAGR